nr:T9SS sorting signal type C domain-containing protein [uncultured Flavobacterium sp.]
MKRILLFAVLFFTIALASAANRYSVATGLWSSTSTWSATSGGAPGASVPVAGDVVFIERGFNVTLTANAACSSLTFTTTTATSLTLGSFQLDVSGAITIPRSGAGINLIAVGAGNLNAGSIDFTSGGSTVRHQISISTGTVTVSGNISGTTGNTSGSITFTGAGLLRIGGTIFNSSTGTLTTVAGSTVEYNGVVQTVGNFTYSNLTLSGSGTKTFSTNTVINSNLIVATGVVVNLNGITTHTAGSLTLGGIGPLLSSWGANGSGAANTSNVYFTGSGRITVNGTPPYPAIDNNFASYTNGNFGTVADSYGENVGPPVFTAPNGTIFINVKFASYGTPSGLPAPFTLGTCDAFNSRTIATAFLGNTTASIGATNAIFGDPCYGTYKKLSIQATYTEPICAGTNPGIITGSTPTGGNGSYTYLWEVSTTSSTTGYSPASGTNNAKDYTPDNVPVTTWYRRTVTSGMYSSATIVIVQVNTNPTVPTNISGTTAICAGNSTTLTVSGGSLGGPGGYAQWYSDSCGGTLIGTGNSITVSPTSNTTYYVRYKSGCSVTNCISVTVTTSVSITNSPAATSVCASSSNQTTPLTYSGTTGSPSTYSIVWNAIPSNSFVAVTNVTLPAGSIQLTVPGGTAGGTYTGTLTVRNGTCVSFGNTFTITVNSLPSAPTVGTITQPTCALATGSVALSGLPSSGSWTITATPATTGLTGLTGTNVDNTNIGGLTANTSYTFVVSNGTCSSTASTAAVINTVPATATWNGAWTGTTPAGSNPLLTQPIVFNGDYTSTGDINGCSCTVTSGNIVINSGHTMTITNAVNVTNNATTSLVFEDQSSLVQTTNATNTGSIEYRRISKPMKNFDFTYWSSPVFGQTTVGLSPNTLADKYFRFDGLANDWVLHTTAMIPGAGYIIRVPKPGSPAPDNWSGSTYSQPVAFKGVPNNGNYSFAVGANQYNLVGNPYPSAINADDFINANGIIYGALYFWTHNTAIQQSGSNYIYTADDYASYTLSGGTGTGVGNFVDANGNGTMDPGEEMVSNRPLGKIAAGQSFFVGNGAAGSFQFTNAMRVSGNNSQFFKQASTKKTTTIEKNRVWLNLTNSGGAFKQLLVGYITGATNDWDNLYDGPSFDGQEFVDFYSVNKGQNLTIQGRALPFETTDVVPLGYRSTIAGSFDISIDNKDGALTNQEIWLEDKKTNTLHELSKGKYTFTAINGVENDRFVLKYTNKTLGTDDNELADKSLIVSVKNKRITLTSSAEAITQVQVFDLLGRKVYDKSKINAQEWSISTLSSSEQALIVKTTLANGAISSKKIIY